MCVCTFVGSGTLPVPTPLSGESQLRRLEKSLAFCLLYGFSRQGNILVALFTGIVCASADGTGGDWVYCVCVTVELISSVYTTDQREV